MAVKKLSNIGGIGSIKTTYPNMLTNYGDFGAMQRIQYGALNGNSIDITDIPSTYQDLFLVLYVRSTAAVTTTQSIIYFNGDAGSSNYARTVLQGNGSSASSFRETNYAQLYFLDGVPGASATSGIYLSSAINILNYKNTSTFKTLLIRNAADMNGSGLTSIGAGLWRSTAAINRIQIGPVSGSFANGSTFALYGIKASAV